MADPFTIAVSVAGLAGFGVQLVQVLNQYAGSATDSKGRIRAVSNDIKLTIEVLNVFKHNMELEAHRQCMSDGAGSLAMEAIQMCEDIFRKIEKLLHGAGGKPGVTNSTGNQSNPAQVEPAISFLQKLKWPLVEPKLDILRGNLEKVKTTLQLLMSVITFAVMSKMHSDRGSIDRQKAEIERLKLEKIEADTKLKLLLQAYPRLDEDVDATGEALALPIRQRAGRSNMPCHSSAPGMFSGAPGESVVAVSPSSVSPSFGAFNLAIAPPPVHPTPVHQPRSPHVGNMDAQSNEDQGEVLPQNSAPIGSPNGFVMPSPRDVNALHADYIACLQQLNALQSKLENALSKLFHTTVGRDDETKINFTTLSWSERSDTHDKVIQEAQYSIDVFEHRLIHAQMKDDLHGRARGELVTSQLSPGQTPRFMIGPSGDSLPPSRGETPVASGATTPTGSGSMMPSHSEIPWPQGDKNDPHARSKQDTPIRNADSPEARSRFGNGDARQGHSNFETSLVPEHFSELNNQIIPEASKNYVKQETEAEEYSPANRRMEGQQAEGGEEPPRERVAQHTDIEQPTPHEVFNIVEDEMDTTSDVDDYSPFSGDSLWLEGTLPTVNDLLRLWTK